MTKWTAPDIASIRGDNSRPLQKIFGSLTEYLNDYQINSLDSLSDVTITTPTVGQLLSYDATNSLWINTTGSVITNLNASNLASGTVPTGRVSGSYAGITGVGTITTGTWSGLFGAVSGANLTTLNASNLSSGTVASARISGSYTGITGVGTLSAGSIPATLLSGTIASARLSGAYTGITGLGTLTSLVINGSNSFSPAITLGDWNQNGEFTAIRSEYGYLLLGSGNGPNRNIYLRTETSAGTVILGGGLNNNVMTVGATDVTIAGSLALSASTNAYVSYANTPDTAMPWMQGPTFQGQTGWAFYSSVLGSYRMGFRSGSSGVTRYLWTADRCLLGSGPNDGLMNDTVNVIGSSIWVQSMPASTGATVVNNFGFLRYVSSRRELKDNIINVELSDGLDRILALRPVEFTMKPEYLADANEYTPFDVKRGFIAQETAEVDHRYGQWGWVNENQMMATTSAINGELPLEEATPIYWNHDAVIADVVASIQNINARLQQLETV